MLPLLFQLHACQESCLNKAKLKRQGYHYQKSYTFVPHFPIASPFPDLLGHLCLFSTAPVW